MSEFPPPEDHIQKALNEGFRLRIQQNSQTSVPVVLVGLDDKWHGFGNTVDEAAADALGRWTSDQQKKAQAECSRENYKDNQCRPLLQKDETS